MEDFLKSIKFTLNERLTSPFYGAFIISWLIINWDLWYVTFFHPDGVMDKEFFYNDSFQYIIAKLSLSKLVIYPFGSCLFIIIIMPYFTNMLYEKYLEYNKERIEIKDKIDKSTPISKERAANLWLSIEENKKEIQTIIENNEIEKSKFDLKLSESKKINENLVAEKTILNEQISKLLEEKDVIIERFHNHILLEPLDFLQGGWVNNIPVQEKQKLPYVEYFNISGTNYTLSTNENVTLKIQNVHTYEKNNTRFIEFEKYRPSDGVLFKNILKIININKISGTENGLEITYTRQYK